MSKTVEFYYDFGSPATFLAHTQMPGIAERTGATIDYKPVLLGGVFKATGNSSPVLVPAKSRWMGRDLIRYAKRYGVHFRFPTGFPINTLPLMRGAVGYLAQSAELHQKYVDMIFKAMWQDEVDMRDNERFAKLLNDNDFDANEFLMMVAEPEVKEGLIARTDEAVEKGMFGAPTFVVDGQLHFGQDRLDWVEESAASAG